jgi:hypothetical protein
MTLTWILDKYSVPGLIVETPSQRISRGGGVETTMNIRQFDDAVTAVAYPGIFSGGGATNSVEDRGHRERGSWSGSPLVRGSTQFANE